MPHFFVQWTDEIVGHLAENGISPEEFEHVVRNPVSKTASRSSGRPGYFGWTVDGRFLLCIYEHLDLDTIVPVTAFEITEE